LRMSFYALVPKGNRVSAGHKFLKAMSARDLRANLRSSLKMGKHLRPPTQFH